VSTPIHAGTVEWSGENPGIYLKVDEAGPWSALTVFFRVVVSAHGRGHGVVVLGAPGVAEGLPKTPNFCLTDNMTLMKYLVAEFVSRYPTFRGTPGLGAMTYHALRDVKTDGDARRYYSETLTSPDVSVKLLWEEIEDPVAAEVPVAMSTTGAHEMYSVFQGAKRASIVVNGAALPGRVIMRDFFGSRMTTGFLAFSETWIRPPAQS
jgi:hypothetical protein